MPSEAHLNPQPAPLPSTYECLGCLYDRGSSTSRGCPECGRIVGDADLETFAAREHASTQIAGMLLLHLLVGISICAAFSSGVAVLTGSLTRGAEALLVCGIAIGGSIAAGAVASRFARKRERAGYFMAWLRTHIWLNASWLCAPISSLIVVAALFEKPNSSAYGPGGLSLGVALVGLIIWLVATMGCVLRWIVVFVRETRRLALRGKLVRFAFAASALVVLLGSMGLGIGAGGTCLRVADDMVKSRP